MMIDIGYAMRQVRFARACVGRHDTLGADDALSRALDGLLRLQEEAKDYEARIAALEADTDEMLAMVS